MGLPMKLMKRCIQDFAGETPTIYASNLVKNGRFVSGTNSISIGTNSAWNFLISTTDSHVIPALLDGIQGHTLSTITIASQTTNGESVLSLTPYYVMRTDGSKFTQSMFWRAKIGADVDMWFYGIAIKLKVPNHFSYGESVSLDEPLTSKVM